MMWRRLKYLLPFYRRAEEREMCEELDSLAEIAEPRELGNLTQAAENACGVGMDLGRTSIAGPALTGARIYAIARRSPASPC